jgi:cell division protein FtsL
MNAITRVATQGSLVGNRITLISFPLPGLRVLILVVMLLVSAFAIIYIKDVNRRLFIDYQNLQYGSNVLEINHEKLLLENSAWSRQARIQELAEQDLNMKVPSAANVIVVKL